MKQKKLRITQEDFILANRKAARMEEIERHGRQVQSRRMVHKSKKTYDRNRLKRAVIKSDDGSFYLYEIRYSVRKFGRDESISYEIFSITFPYESHL